MSIKQRLRQILISLPAAWNVFRLTMRAKLVIVLVLSVSAPPNPAPPDDDVGALNVWLYSPYQWQEDEEDEPEEEPEEDSLYLELV
jgi:hypothetical protein